MPSSRFTRRYRMLRENVRMERRPCHLCGHAIDYDLPPNHPMSFSVDHIKPYSTHPHLREDPSNLAAAHNVCNKRRGDRPPTVPLGANSRDW